VNTDPAGCDLSFEIQHQRPAASPGLRRGITLTPVKIARGGTYDICEQLHVSFADAERLRLSPQVILFERGQRLRVHKVMDDGSVVDLSAVHSPLPDQTRPETSPTTPTPEPVRPTPPAPVPKLVDEPAPPPLEAKEEEAKEEPKVEGETQAIQFPEGDPTMDWSDADLRAFAAVKQIDISKAKSKTALLKTIRKAIGKE
jgi:hypothetical protein